MRPDLWFAFVAATLVIGLIPGPGVAAILGYAIGSGRRTAFASVAGLMLGNLAASTASLLGTGAVLAASSFLFGLLKWAGAAYLIAVGALGLWRARCRCGADPPAPDLAPRGLSGQSGRRHLPPQDDPVPRSLRSAVHRFAPRLLAPGGDIGGDLRARAGADRLLLRLGSIQRGGLLRSPWAQAWAQRAGGGALIFAGLATAAIRR